MTTAALLILAGGLGAVHRALIDALGRRWQAPAGDGPVPDGRAPTIPWPTTAINVTGSLAAGLIAGAVDTHPDAPAIAAVLSVGYLGAFTTFSTAMLQTVDLVLAGAHRRALVHGVVPLTASVVAAGLGWTLTG